MESLFVALSLLGLTLGIYRLARLRGSALVAPIANFNTGQEVGEAHLG